MSTGLEAALSVFALERNSRHDKLPCNWRRPKRSQLFTGFEANPRRPSRPCPTRTTGPLPPHIDVSCRRRHSVSSPASSTVVGPLGLRRAGHRHAALSLVTLLNNTVLGQAGGNLLVVLDQGAARAPVSGAAIAHSVALDAELLTDLAPLHHGVAKGMHISHHRR